MIAYTCAYDLIVPEASYESDEPWIAKAYRDTGFLLLREALPQGSAERVRVRITHISPNPGVFYSCVVLTPVEPTSEVWPLHFHIERRMTTKLCAGDLVHIRTTHCGGLGISILRNGMLLAAAGAVCSVPLGRHVIARYPHDLFDEAFAVIRRKYPDFALHESPVEVIVGDVSSLLLRARTEVETRGHLTFSSMLYATRLRTSSPAATNGQSRRPISSSTAAMAFRIGTARRIAQAVSRTATEPLWCHSVRPMPMASRMSRRRARPG